MAPISTLDSCLASTPAVLLRFQAVPNKTTKTALSKSLIVSLPGLIALLLL